MDGGNAAIFAVLARSMSAYSLTMDVLVRDSCFYNLAEVALLLKAYLPQCLAVD